MKELRWAARRMKPYWRQFSLSTLLALATVASGLGLLTTSAYLIAAAALQPSIAELQVAIVAVRSLGLARGLLRYAERYLSHNLTFKLLGQIRLWVYSQIEPLAPAILVERESGDLLTRLIDDVETMQFFYLRALQPPLVAASGTLILLAVLTPLDLWLAIVWACLLLCAGLLIPLVSRRLSRSVQTQMLLQRAEVKQLTVELIQGLPEWLAFNAGAAQIAKVNHAGSKLKQLQNRLAAVSDLNQAGLTFLTQLAPVIVLWLSLPLLHSGQLSGVQLAVLVVAAMASFELVTPLTEALPAMEAGLSAARRLLDLAQREPATSGRTATPSDKKLVSADLSIRDLHFSYSPSRLPALDGIDLTIHSGQRVALVGPSGAGKSTLFNLLLRFWDFSTGSIKLGGIDLRSLSPDQARAYFSVVSARTTLFGGSLRQNLLLAQPEASQTQLIQALEAAGASDLLALTPAGLDTKIGEWGLGLSAGQRQRVALALALLQDRAFLLLDEPTANLDPGAAQIILADLLQATAGKTTLLITHQLIGLTRFDRLFVLQHGRIIQRGTHDQLVRQPGLYRDMWQLQVERWRIEGNLGTA